MEYGSETLASLVKAFSRLPGIGTKTAQRLALFLLRGTNEEAETLGRLLLTLKDKVRFCRRCGGITEAEECAICKDPARNRQQICVVEEPQDVLTLEKTGQYRGLYHVLHGVLSPIDGVTPDKLNLRKKCLKPGYGTHSATLTHSIRFSPKPRAARSALWPSPPRCSKICD